MKFKKLELDEFSKSILMDNQLRSINGGELNTCYEDCPDVLYPDGSTEWCNDECTENDCENDGFAVGGTTGIRFTIMSK